MPGFRRLVVLFMSAALVLSLAGPAWALFGSEFKDEVDLEKVAVKLAQQVQQGGYEVIPAEELKKWIDAKKDMIIVDTTPFDMSYKKAHVPGAKQFQFPMPDMNTWDTKETAGKTQEDFKALLGPDLNKTIVIYCGRVKCGRSHNGATWAKKLGYKNVYRCPGGIFAWQGADYPVASSK